MPTTTGQEELLLLPYTQAIEILAGRNISVTFAMPPYPSIGVGTLRVVRATVNPGEAQLVLSYDDYERLS